LRNRAAHTTGIALAILGQARIRPAAKTHASAATSGARNISHILQAIGKRYGIHALRPAAYWHRSWLVAGYGLKREFTLTAMTGH